MLSVASMALVSNAGILQDKSYKMDDSDWDLVYRVHVERLQGRPRRGWRMREQNYGRVIFTASTSGIYVAS